MTSDWSLPAWAAVVTVLVLATLLMTLLAVLRGRRKAARRAEESEAATRDLRSRLDEIERRIHAQTTSPAGSATSAQHEYVITSLGQLCAERSGESAPPLPAPAFADTVLRETVVHSAALLHGVRRALSPEVRNRVRFEIKRELKRSRKARKTEVREALREYRARHRADATDITQGNADAADDPGYTADRPVEGEVA